MLLPVPKTNLVKPYFYFIPLPASDWAALLPLGVTCVAIGFGAKILFDKQVSQCEDDFANYLSCANWNDQ